MLITFLDLHLKMQACELYVRALWRHCERADAGARPPGTSQAHRRLQNAGQFAPFVAGDTLTQVDCAAFCALPALGMATKAVCGQDLMEAGRTNCKPYLRMLGAPSSVQEVMADRQAATVKAP